MVTTRNEADVFEGGSKKTDKTIDLEIASLALPTLATLAADPLASLVATAYIGHLGSVQLASVGIALSVFNTVTRLFNMPLLSVTTSTVATAVGTTKGDSAGVGVASSTALLLGLLVGLSEAAVLTAVAGAGLALWGVPVGSPMRVDALDFLLIRAWGAPATVLLLVVQGVFRGLGDTRTPLYATVACNLLNIFLNPLFIFTLGWGVRGSASATILSELAAALGLVLALTRRCNLRLTGKAALQDAAKFLGPTGLLAIRTVAISGTFALATALAARSGSAHAAAHQICLQLWLASSLLADSLAVAAQSLMARSLAGSDRDTARKVVARTIRLGGLLGVILSGALALGSGVLPGVFSRDPSVLAVVAVIWPWVVLTQPITALAFVWDGVLYGANGFQYAAKAMAVCAAPAMLCMLLGLWAPITTPDVRLTAVWLGLAVLMGMRALTIYLPYKRQSAPFDRLFERP
ncbi:hypothetical protein WJX72_002062 [[Myrmecia] bisecta]|uniref:Protein DETOXIFICATION n=1 Tax=[Myrmecia] bisecta TaxID=41462 RepID=A0AAW1QPD6_9CHLO